MRKFSSILFLCLLLLHVAGFSILTFWNSWETENNIVANEQIEIKGDSLIHKYALSLPYSTNFEQSINNTQTAIFEGDFYQSIKIKYQGDTVFTYYVLANYSRENILAIVKDFSNSMTLDFSKKTEKSSQQAQNYFKKISKHYLTQNQVITTIFWKESIDFEHFVISNLYLTPVLNKQEIPPIFI